MMEVSICYYCRHILLFLLTFIVHDPLALLSSLHDKILFLVLSLLLYQVSLIWHILVLLKYLLAQCLPINISASVFQLFFDFPLLLPINLSTISF